MQNAQKQYTDFVYNERVRQKQTFLKKVLTKGEESGRIIKLSRKAKQKKSLKRRSKKF